MGDRQKTDEIDIKILRAMLKDARTSFVNIGRECGLSSNSIRLRYEKLRKTGVIKGAITQVNPKKLGHNFMAFVLIQTHASKMQQTYDALKNTPNILHITKLMGRYNIMLVVAIKEVNEIDAVTSFVKGNAHVEKMDIGISWDLVNVDHAENLEIKATEGK